jgi:hypothetical protein
MYRPEGWKNPYVEYHEDFGYLVQDDEFDAYEAGANAMYQPAYDKGREEEREALRRKGNSRGGRVENDIVFGTGTWVFIPEEL